MSILNEIIESKTLEVRELQSIFDISHAKSQVASLARCVDFVRAFQTTSRVPIVAEIKRRSPSRGNLAGEIDVAKRAKLYEESGAVAISVLTDSKYFGGCMQDLEACKAAVDIPVLRKDFIIDEVQLYQSRLAGADAVLLIVAALSNEQYARLLETTVELGMAPLSEVHDLDELRRILPFSPPIVGINNRNLHTLETDINVTKELMSAVPEPAIAISESGVHSTSQIDELLGHGVNGFLIGTSLMTSEKPFELLKEMCNL